MGPTKAWDQVALTSQAVWSSAVLGTTTLMASLEKRQESSDFRKENHFLLGIIFFPFRKKKKKKILPRETHSSQKDAKELKLESPSIRPQVSLVITGTARRFLFSGEMGSPPH